MRDQAFYVFTLSFFIGIFLASVFAIPLVFAVIFFVISCGIPLFARNKTLSLLVLGAGISFSLGIIRMDATKIGDSTLDRYLGEKKAFVGTVCDEPQAKELALKFCFEPGGQKERILVTAARYPEYSYGDKLWITGSIELPENFEAYEGGPMFDYVSYLGKDGIRFIMKRAKIEDLMENHANPIVSALFSIKKAFLGNIERLTPEPYSSLVAGILLGEKGLLPEELSTAFKRTGLTHILVLSGSNVSVVVGGLMKAFASLPRTLGQSLGAVSIVLFAIMTGASATTVRASVMALIFILAGGVGRKYDIVRALVLAALLMLMENPRILVFDVSFQLSFLSTLALIYVSPIVSEKLSWITERFELRGILSATIATQVFTTPFILYVMGEMSVIALAPNILVLPVVPWAMLGGFLTGIVGFFGGLAAPFAWITDFMLAYVVRIVYFWSDFPFAAKRLSLGEPLLISIYVFYAWFIFRWRRRNSSRRSSS